MQKLFLIFSAFCLVELAGCNPSTIDKPDGSIDEAAEGEGFQKGEVQPHELSDLVDRADKLVVQEVDS